MRHLRRHRRRTAQPEISHPTPPAASPRPPHRMRRPRRARRPRMSTSMHSETRRPGAGLRARRRSAAGAASGATPQPAQGLRARAPPPRPRYRRKPRPRLRRPMRSGLRSRRPMRPNDSRGNSRMLRPPPSPTPLPRRPADTRRERRRAAGQTALPPGAAPLVAPCGRRPSPHRCRQCRAPPRP